MAKGTSTSEGNGRKPKVLVVGLGNILLGDEGAGVHTVRRIIETSRLPPGVEVMDGGTAGYALIDRFGGFDRLVIIDAVRGGGPPGRIYRLGTEDLAGRDYAGLSGHQIGLPEVFALAERLGELPETTIFGIEPGRIDYGTGLSPEVEEAVRTVAGMVTAELDRAGKGEAAGRA